MQQTFEFSKKTSEKLFFKIREVGKILGVEPYVLRFWETEFKNIRPAKSKGGQRLYRQRDIEALQQIKTLLYDEKFTISGAKLRLKEFATERKKEQPKLEANVKEILRKVREEVKELIKEVG